MGEAKKVPLKFNRVKPLSIFEDLILSDYGRVYTRCLMSIRLKLTLLHISVSGKHHANAQ